MFEKISPFEIDDNAFKLLDKDWMLVTAGKPGEYNTMTASWGHLGILWSLPVAVCYIRPQRHTFGFANRFEDYTLSFFTDEYRKALQFCGSKSGRDYDKAKECGLTVMETENGSVSFKEARMIMECRKIYQDDLKLENFLRKDIAEKNYPKNDFHRMYFGEILNVMLAEKK